MFTSALKQRWLQWNLRERGKPKLRSMERLYRIRDPWNLNSADEHHRFCETVRLIRENIGIHFPSILEIGCGEGVQSQYLAPLTGRLLGLDPSLRAVERARERKIANAEFTVGDLIEHAKTSVKRYALVTACEVIYYVEDIDSAFHSLNRIGEKCVVTYYRGMYERLDAFFANKPVESKTICKGTTEWRFIWWDNSSCIVDRR